MSDKENPASKEENPTDPANPKEETPKPEQPTFKAPASQEEMDRMVQDRLRRKEEEVKTQTEKDVRAAIQREADEAAAKEKGEFEKLYNGAKDEIVKLKGEIDTLKAQVADKDLGSIRRDMAAKHHLPADMADRLKGSDAKEIEDDAKALAKLIPAKIPPDPETGIRTRKGSGPGAKTPSFAFGSGGPRVKFPGRETPKQE